MRVFNIPASISFLPCAIDALLSGRLIASFVPRDNPALLAKATLYLPTQRACRAAREVFLDQLGGEAAILPRIIAVGNLDGDVIDFTARLFGLSGKEAALKLAEDFSVRYDAKGHDPPRRRPVKRKISEELRYRQAEQKCFRVLFDYLYLLERCEK